MNWKVASLGTRGKPTHKAPTCALWKGTWEPLGWDIPQKGLHQEPSELQKGGSVWASAAVAGAILLQLSLQVHQLPTCSPSFPVREAIGAHTLCSPSSGTQSTCPIVPQDRYATAPSFVTVCLAVICLKHPMVQGADLDLLPETPRVKQDFYLSPSGCKYLCIKGQMLARHSPPGCCYSLTGIPAGKGCQFWPDIAPC